jgi:RNA polymerase-binding transcription factor DksA
VAVDVDRFRELLREERQRVVDAIEYLHKENPGSIETRPKTTTDTRGDRDRDARPRDRPHPGGELGERSPVIDGALARIDQGTYGTCVNCGKPISRAARRDPVGDTHRLQGWRSAVERAGAP